jgi:hypothetical protein
MVSYMGLLPVHYASHYEQNRKDQNIGAETFVEAQTCVDSRTEFVGICPIDS